MESTTEISELPIKPNNPPVSGEERSARIVREESNIIMDSSIQARECEGKRVKFANDPNHSANKSSEDNKSNMFSVSNESKLILLASVLFFIFIECWIVLLNKILQLPLQS